MKNVLVWSIVFKSLHLYWLVLFMRFWLNVICSQRRKFPHKLQPVSIQIFLKSKQREMLTNSGIRMKYKSKYKLRPLCHCRSIYNCNNIFRLVSINSSLAPYLAIFVFSRLHIVQCTFSIHPSCVCFPAAIFGC